MDRVVVYLAGGIRTNRETGLNDDVYRIDGEGWRGLATEALSPYGIDAHDPRFKVGGFTWDVNEIVDLDLFEIERSTLLLVEMMDESYPYIGTTQEMVYAKLYRKPTIVFTNPARAGHPWVRYHATKVFLDYQDAIGYVQDRFGGPVPLNAWRNRNW